MALQVLELLLKVLYTAVLFCECNLSIMIGLLHITKSILEFIDLCMQLADFPLYVLITINFNGVDEHGPGALYSIFNIETL